MKKPTNSTDYPECISLRILTKNEISPKFFQEVFNKVFLESDLWNHNQSKYLWNHRGYLKAFNMVKRAKSGYKNINNNEKKKMKYKNMKKQYSC